MNVVEKIMVKAPAEAAEVFVKNRNGRYRKKFVPVLGAPIYEDIFVAETKTRAQRYAKDIKAFLKTQ